MVTVIASVTGAIAVGGVACYSWYRTVLLEKRSERLLRKISAEIDDLVRKAA